MKEEKVRIKVRLTEEEKEKLERSSALCGLTQSEYVRQLGSTSQMCSCKTQQRLGPCPCLCLASANLGGRKKSTGLWNTGPRRGRICRKSPFTFFDCSDTSRPEGAASCQADYLEEKKTSP